MSKPKAFAISGLNLALLISFFHLANGQGRRRATPKPTNEATRTVETSDVQTVDGITRLYDPANNVTLVVSKEISIFDNTPEGAVHPLRVTINLAATYTGRLQFSDQTSSDPIVRILFKYRYFVAKFDVGEPRDFAIFAGISTLLASGQLTFVGREDVGRDVVTTMQVAMRASEFEKTLRSMEAARSVSFFLGRETFPLTSKHLASMKTFLSATPHPQIDVVSKILMKLSHRRNAIFRSLSHLR